MYFKLIHPLTKSAAAKLHSLLGVYSAHLGISSNEKSRRIVIKLSSSNGVYKPEQKRLQFNIEQCLELHRFLHTG